MSSEDLLARAAHLYYVLGLTQQTVADRLGVTRIKAHRLLAEARERGVVRFQINAPSAARLDLEAALADTFKLSFVSITPSEHSEQLLLSEVIGQYAAPVVQPLFESGSTIAMAWGITLKALAGSLDPVQLDNVVVVPLLGSLSRRSSIDKFEAATLLAERLGGESYYLPGPIICDSREARETILAQPMAYEVFERARRANIALMSVGGMNSSTLRAMTYLRDGEFESVKSAGAIGNFLGYFLDANAEVMDHPVNERVVGVHPDDARRIPTRIMVSGGERKVLVLRALLERGWLTGIITDEATARALAG